MFTDELHIFGAGGHAKVVIDAAVYGFTIVGAYDSDSTLKGRTVLGIGIQAPPEMSAFSQKQVHVAIGSANAREKVLSSLVGSGAIAKTIIHPASSLSPYAKYGNACFLAAHSVIAPDVTLGESVIVNHGAVVDHDCEVGDYSHIAPGATVAGGVKIGRATLIGAGANILPMVQIGNNVTIGAGAVVINDVGDGETVVGVPARRVEGLNND